jgi:NitT/TauT family transport system substrate-binding protein
MRVGFLANLTHAPVLTAVASGRLASALAPTQLETRVFRAGPRVVEALVGRAIDVGVCGPAAVVVANARHGAGSLRVLSGCASGGASFVVAPHVQHAADLRGAQLAVTQLGSTQDVSLRKYLRERGLATAEQGGDVKVTALTGAAVREQMRRGELAGAWLPEPWATSLVVGGGAVRLIDERDLWDDGRFSSAMVVAGAETTRTRAGELGRLADVVAAEIRRITEDAEAGRAESHAELNRLARNAGSRAVHDEAWRRLDFTADPLADAVARFARDAVALRVLPNAEWRGLFG